nr:unnamed protein product [Callosobruchus analis]
MDLVETVFTECEETPESAGQLDHGLLIEAIQGYPYLYDMSDKLYKNNKKKAEAWEVIADMLNCTVQDCVKAWKNLRDRFVKEKNRCASGSQAPEVTWKYFDAMTFYGKYTKPRKTHTSTRKNPQSVPPSSDSSRPSSTMSLWSTVDEVCEESTLIKTPSHEEGAGPSGRKRQLSLDIDTPTSSAESKSAKRMNENLPNTFLEVAKQIIEKIDTKQRTNPNRTFCDYLFCELEKLTEAEAKEKRKQILNNVFSD